MPTSFEAEITETTQNVGLIRNPEQIEFALAGWLTHPDGRTILVTKGGNDANQTAYLIYDRFSRETDTRGNRFKFSLKRRGLINGDPVFNQPQRVGGDAFLAYLNSWFVACELLDNATMGKALILLPEFTKYFGALYQQGRFAALFHGMFENVE